MTAVRRTLPVSPLATTTTDRGRPAVGDEPGDEPGDDVLTLVHSAAASDAAQRPSIRTALVPGTLLDFLRDRTTGLVAQAGPTPVVDPDDSHDADVDEELMDRLQDMYRSALPQRLSAITEHTSAGNAPAVASAAITLAGTSGQLGHPEVASICQAIAADARRGVLAHARVQELHALAGA